MHDYEIIYNLLHSVSECLHLLKPHGICYVAFLVDKISEKVVSLHKHADWKFAKYEISQT